MQGHRIKTIIEEFNLILPRFIEKLESAQEATIGFKKVRLVFNEQQQKIISEYFSFII